MVDYKKLKAEGRWRKHTGQKKPPQQKETESRWAVGFGRIFAFLLGGIFIAVVAAIGVSIYLSLDEQFDSVIDYEVVSSNSHHRQLVRDGIELWTTLNPDTEFAEVTPESNDLDLQITFIDIPEDRDYTGLYCEGTCGDSRKGYDEILVDIGSVTCNGEFVAYIDEEIVDTVAHEIGHHLELGHHRDENHLLYGDRNPPPMLFFDDRGFNIPSRPNDTEHSRVGTAEIDLRIAEIMIQLDSLTMYYDGDGTRFVDNVNLHETNLLISEWGNLVDEQNCLNNVENDDNLTTFMPTNLRPAESSSDDHGNSFADATTINPVQQVFDISGIIETADDVDYFVFDVAQNGRFFAFTAGDVDTVGELFNENGTLLIENDDLRSDNLNFLISIDLSPGTYYLEISSFGEDTGDYGLGFSFSPN